jgi:hypothetical protein
MQANTKKSILLSLTVLVLAAVLTGYYFYNKGPLDVKSSKGIPATSTELYHSFSTDSVGAHKKYTGKVVAVSGEVTEISTNTRNQKIVLIKTGEEGGHVNCTMEGELGNIRHSGRITVKGIVTGIGQGDADLGILGDVYLIRCYDLSVNK